jgi:Dual specificity phosphatase, catalytic domain
MKLTPVRLAIVLLALSAAALVGLQWWARSYDEGPNYSLIEDGLYMGGSVDRPPPGTQSVLNLCEREDPYLCQVHDWTMIRDAAPAPDLDWLRRRVEFVDRQRRAGRTTYVHCFAGISRAGMVVTAYLMFKHGWSRDQALEYVRSKRPRVRPNPAFMERLAEWENELAR